MRVRILTAMPGLPAGTVLEMDDARASGLIGRGDAEVTKDKVTRQVEKAETATADPTK